MIWQFPAVGRPTFRHNDSTISLTCPKQTLDTVVVGDMTTFQFENRTGLASPPASLAKNILALTTAKMLCLVPHSAAGVAAVAVMLARKFLKFLAFLVRTDPLPRRQFLTAKNRKLAEATDEAELLQLILLAGVVVVVW
jgi:hypothetical protein